MSEYDGSQFVGIDLHRRRSVIVRTTETGEALEVVRITNDLDSLAAVMARAGEAARRWCSRRRKAWCWAVDALQAGGPALAPLSPGTRR